MSQITEGILPLIFFGFSLGFISCGRVMPTQGPLSPAPDLKRYVRKIFTRTDGSFLTCFISVPQGKKPAPLVFMCQSSGYASMFEKLPSGDYMDLNGWVWKYSGFRHEVRLAFVEKRGVLFGSSRLDPEKKDLPWEYLKHDTKEDRVEDVCMALEELIKDPLVDREKLALLGHGEGASVAAKAALLSPHVTHLGYFCAGGQSRVFELLWSKRDTLGKSGKSELKIQKEMDGFYHTLAKILDQPDDIDRFYFGVTPSHFSSYNLYPPVEDLLKLRIPIFVAIGSRNSFVPLASADFIRLRFLLQGKENLMFKIYPGLDHGFQGLNPDDPEAKNLFQYPRVFDEFVRWVLKE